MDKQWFNLKEASLYTGIGIWTLREMIYTGKLTSYKPQGTRKVILNKKELDSFIQGGSREAVA